MTPMRHFVVGTAGHIDHGKSALVKALTGTDPDRLEEEKRRGMTIDLGFAHLDLPSGRRVGIVDVPGHERLIKNMLAGATGIDLVLLVIAADEGVMPQTREHFDILRFLPVKQGIVVLNKIDLIDDADWLALVKDDVNALLAGSAFERSPLVEVSAKTGQGIADVVATMDRLLDMVPTRELSAPARLPIDRAFSIAGFGTVVTGTLWSGRIRSGDVLELLPLGRSVRVRGIQVHGHEVPETLGGSRAALNLVGVDKDEVGRGDVLATPGVFQPTSLIDVRVSLLPTAPPLAHLARVRLYLGSDEVIGRFLLLDRTRLGPSEVALGQLRLEKPIVTAAKDPIVLRRYSPMVTVGGGEVITAHPPRRRRSPASVSDIERASHAGLDDLIEHAVRAAGRTGTTADELVRQLGASHTQVDEVLRRLHSTGRVLQIRAHFFHNSVQEEIRVAIVGALDAYHRRVPWRLGMPKEELKAVAFGNGDDRLYARLVEQVLHDGGAEEVRGFLHRSGHKVVRTQEETGVREKILTALRSGRYAPPSRDALAKLAGPPNTFAQMFQAVLDEGLVVEVAPEIFFHAEVLDEIKRAVASHITAAGSLTVAELRDLLGTSRKFALTVLEHFDTIKVTRRVGDARVLVEARPVSQVHSASSDGS